MSESRQMPTRRADYGYWVSYPTRWRDNDPYGHLNNAVYFEYIDSIVNKFLIDNGVLDVMDGEIIGVVAQSWCRFHGSLAYPETIDVGLRVIHIGNSSIRYDIGLFRSNEDVAAVVGGFAHVYINRSSGRPVAIPDNIRALAQTLVSGMDDREVAHG